MKCFRFVPVRSRWTNRSWLLLLLATVGLILPRARAMSPLRREELREAVKEIFYFGFNGYMQYAFPRDELDPINCVGIGINENSENAQRNDVHGDFALTLVDSLDTFVVLGDKKGFEDAVWKTVKHVSFDVNSKVQVFEVNIRVLGGLLSAHLFATDPSLDFEIEGYNNELLALAYDLGERLLPAFSTKTGIPYSRVNLKYGVSTLETTETCTAGAGTFVLEFGVLSRLTNDTRFEDAARGALYTLWDFRSKLDMIGNVIDIETGTWIHIASSVGAGIDSFFEYLMKAYVLFGEYEYLSIFNEAYDALLRYIRDKNGYFYRNVNMYNGGLMSYWVDSLSAFLPGLQVLIGDLDNAIRGHLIYYNIWRRYRAMPERFNFLEKASEHGTYPLRPEFIESTYFLYRATRDPFYLDVGEMVLRDLNSYARTRCGLAGLANISTGKKDTRMESFVLAEMFKYLYLLFDEDNLFNRMENYVFTTEAHVFVLPKKYLRTEPPAMSHNKIAKPPTCLAYQPYTLELHRPSVLLRPDADFAQVSTGIVTNAVHPLSRSGYCDVSPDDNDVLELSFEESSDLYQSEQLLLFTDGVVVNWLSGLKMELMRPLNQHGYSVTRVGKYSIPQGRYVEIRDPLVTELWAKQRTYERCILRVFGHDNRGDVDFEAALAMFGPRVTGQPTYALASVTTDMLGCTQYSTVDENAVRDKVALVRRGGCTFLDKAINAEAAGARAVVVSNDDNHLFEPAAPSKRHGYKVGIPCVLVTNATGLELERRLWFALHGSQLVEVAFTLQLKHMAVMQSDSEGRTKLMLYGHVINNIQLNLNMSMPG